MEHPATDVEQQPRRRGKSPYFLRPAKGGEVTVFHKPCGNRISPKDCGTMPSRALALKLIAQLERAESAVDDLFLEATDDGIEALEAVLQACRESVIARAAAGRNGGGQPRRRRRRRE